MLIVAVLPSILFAPKRTSDRRTAGRPDSTARLVPTAPESAATPARPSGGPPVRPTVVAAETVWVTSPLYRLGFSTRGGALVRAQLSGYRSFAKADSGRPVQLVRDGVPLLVYRRTGGGGDTTLVSDWILTPSATRVQVGSEGATTLTFTGARDGARVMLEYRFFPAEYRFGARGRMEGFGPAGATLLLGLGDGLRSVEADSMDDFRHYAVVTKATKTQRTDFGSLKAGKRKILDGPFE